MKIFITGGTGFIGRQLANELTARGHQLTILSRSVIQSPQGGNIRFITGNPQEPGAWQHDLQKHEAVVNLAGSTIFCRWSQRNRQRIEESRILTTRNIVAAANDPAAHVKTLLSGSAIGYYGNCGNKEIMETDPAGSNFLADIARKWEMEAAAATKSSLRVIFCRLGVVLGRSGGALSKMLPAFRLGLGSALGSGHQWFSWIHERDLIEAMCFVLEHGDISGPVNFTAPAAVTNRQFSKSLALALHRPFFLPAIPAPLLKLALGETSTLVLDSQKIRPGVLQANNFEFRFPEITAALENLVNIK